MCKRPLQRLQEFIFSGCLRHAYSNSKRTVEKVVAAGLSIEEWVRGIVY